MNLPEVPGEIKESPSTWPKAIKAALLKAQSGLKGVDKSAWNDYSGYSYASSDDVIHACRAALHGAGLVAWSDGYDFQVDDNKQTWVQCWMLLCCAETGDQKELLYRWPVILSDKGKPLDKAIATALTTAFAYWLRGLLALPRRDDEMNRHDAPPADSKQVAKGKATEKQMGMINKLIKDTGTPGESIANRWGPSAELTVEAAGEVIDYLKTLPPRANPKN